ncbi:ankyrin repeat domain-containing protein [Bremerella sp.]|uniref:ankyrin repeat domain-containing protein n=1 Tax=Bremerella sp. TaxID=2795602 RepID=UPI003918F8AB
MILHLRSTIAVVVLGAFVSLSMPSMLYAQAAKGSLVAAAERADWGAVEKQLRAKQDPNARQPDGMTALHWAAFHGSEQGARLLIESGATVDAPTEYQITPLSIACELGKPKVVRVLLEGKADPNLAIAGGETPLMTAARTGVVDSVTQLLEAGAKVDATERNGQTALMWGAAEGHTEVVQRLLDAGGDPNRSLSSGYTALLFAARQGKIEVARTLIASGVDVNGVMRPKSTAGRAPRDKMSALMLAVESGHFELALELVRLGADPNDQRSGYAPLHALTWVRRTNIGDNVDGDPPPRGSGTVTDLEFVRELVRLGADVNLKLAAGNGGRARLNHKGATPFLLAAKTADLPLLEVLLELKADPTLTNVEDVTPLLAASGIGVFSVGEEPGTPEEVIATLRFLCELGADVNHVDGNGETAMHGAAYHNYPEVVAELQRLGAKSQVWKRKSKYQATPIEVAQGKRPGSFKPSPETVAALVAAIEAEKKAPSR